MAKTARHNLTARAEGDGAAEQHLGGVSEREIGRGDGAVAV